VEVVAGSDREDAEDMDMTPLVLGPCEFTRVSALPRGVGAREASADVRDDSPREVLSVPRPRLVAAAAVDDSAAAPVRESAEGSVRAAVALEGVELKGKNALVGERGATGEVLSMLEVESDAVFPASLLLLALKAPVRGWCTCAWMFTLRAEAVGVISGTTPSPAVIPAVIELSVGVRGTDAWASRLACALREGRREPIGSWLPDKVLPKSEEVDKLEKEAEAAPFLGDMAACIVLERVVCRPCGRVGCSVVVALALD